jgi:hypothetical protein
MHVPPLPALQARQIKEQQDENLLALLPNASGSSLRTLSRKRTLTWNLDTTVDLLVDYHKTSASETK